MITVPKSHRQTDGETDGRTIYDRNTALCTKVHRAVKMRIVVAICMHYAVCLQLTDSAFEQLGEHCHDLHTLDIAYCAVSLLTYFLSASR